MSLSTKERKMMRDHLTRRARTLKNRGVDYNDIAKLLGQTSFKNLSDNDLKRLYKKSKKTPQNKVTIINGHIYDKSYILKARAWYGSDFDPLKLSKSYERSLKSKLNEFNSALAIRNHKRVVANQVKKNYIKQLTNLRDYTNLSKDDKKRYTTIISKIRRMSNSDFKKFLSSPYSDKINFNRIILIDSDLPPEFYDDIDKLEIRDVFEDVSKFYEIFMSEK